ncbi:MAG: hypothetical protein H7831_17470 [Magnetococcus sp. WYHC-3]
MVSWLRRRRGQFRPPETHMLLALGLALALMVLWQGLRPGTRDDDPGYPSAPPALWLRLAAPGEPEALSRLLLLRLVNADYRRGMVTPLARWPTQRLLGWLETAARLDPRDLLGPSLALFVYADVLEPQGGEALMRWLAERFESDPRRFAPLLARAVVMARYDLGNAALAQHLAQRLDRRWPGAVPRSAPASEIPDRTGLND